MIRSLLFIRAAQQGFTLIELIMVIVIIGVLGAIAAQQLSPVTERTRIEETIQEMDRLAVAIAGDCDLENNGIRTDFGYVGDIGSLPPDLDALMTNPGYSTWKGPYTQNGFEQTLDDFKKDAWQSDYVYSGEVTITSLGSGTPIIRNIAGSTEDLVRNSVTGNIYDLDGTPPGNSYSDSLSVVLTCPDGAGGISVKAAPVDAGGYFRFDSIPIGNHSLDIVYTPGNDTLRRFVSVLPNSESYGEYFLPADVWNKGGGGSGIEFVINSDTLSAGNCFRLSFWIFNNSGLAITISSMTLSWASPTAYYKNVIWNGTPVRGGNPALGSGDVAFFSASQIVNDGQSIRIEIDAFHANPGGGGATVDMTGATFLTDFSDGSTITFTADVCGG